jgi:hypothetical protein
MWRATSEITQTPGSDNAHVARACGMRAVAILIQIAEASSGAAQRVRRGDNVDGARRRDAVTVLGNVTATYNSVNAFTLSHTYL